MGELILCMASLVCLCGIGTFMLGIWHLPTTQSRYNKEYYYAEYEKSRHYMV